MPKRSLALNAALIARAHPRPVTDDGRAMPLMGEAEADARLDAALAEKPGDPDALWLFAYGALMWRPEFPFGERREARVRGWHRRFCLWQQGFRGTPDCPGVMLALDRGGQCRGLAYRLAGDDLRAALRPVWRREMRGRGYAARWLTAETAEGPVPALAFVADRAGPRYAGRLTDAEIAERIAAACGPIGPSAEYLLNTVAACEAMGIRDRHLWAMQARVAERLAECG
ncbi:gamma-glutamylcyclotransferase [Methylobacterium nonmethylotrophicum]|uniref:glutathione-specific gamma-glutamylcyclotransferase n=1 Tax=Methylobacterium nonmethylotrophicum TaxID=1141884 RepID=A0A4Z0NMY8_9HYPH|nr:gamma-glutamylcyclotransferase [Methylobacterium nonmethylotrophicum]TGD97995.1 gamma-glutamylcyclotransferase [Methylobacterium nonmethylotrophicum]